MTVSVTQLSSVITKITVVLSDSDSDGALLLAGRQEESVVYWDCTLGLYSGTVLWDCTLGLYSGTVFWDCILGLYTALSSTLGLYSGTVFWDCILGLYYGTVLCTE